MKNETIDDAELKELKNKQLSAKRLLKQITKRNRQTAKRKQRQKLTMGEL